MKRHLYTILLPVAAALALSGCTTGSEEARQQAQFVSRFFDIYENSFR